MSREIEDTDLSPFLRFSREEWSRLRAAPLTLNERDLSALQGLRENIAPTCERADLVLEKGEDHQVPGVRLRKL